MKKMLMMSCLVAAFAALALPAHAGKVKAAKAPVTHADRRPADDGEIGPCEACKGFCEDGDEEKGYFYNGKKYKKYESCFTACLTANHVSRDTCN